MLTTDASSLNRLMYCNGSRLMGHDPKLPDADNSIREEGNAAHWLASVVFSSQYSIDELIDRKAPNGVYITPEMAEHVGNYLDEIVVNPSPGAHDWCGMEVPTEIISENFIVNGRADCIAILNNSLFIHDFKYGYTIVEPDFNWTLIAHAIGFCNMHGIRPDKIVFVVHQPRAPHWTGDRVREWVIEWDMLTSLTDRLFHTLNNPTAELHTGSWCYKCPAFASCPARQSAELNAIEASCVAFNAEIDDVEISQRMDMINRAIRLLTQSKKSYEEQITYRLRNGKVIGNYALIPDYGNRSWKEGTTSEIIRGLTGIDVSKASIISPKQAEDKGVPEEVIKAFSENKYKGTKLERISADKHAKRVFGKKG